ncbi:hypothetical protein MYX04_12130 [Nitrospiraceae bacterium AH_259_D15_M11_P09]|nr:hypothetical protein [Nitrospiraceae bacterium AH_259_D15_M11_P09]
MDELFKALRRFITRDLIYLVGGGSVVASFLYVFDRVPHPNDHVILYLLMAGISYVVGYTLQDVFGLLPAFPTAAPRTLNRYQRRLYAWYTRDTWQQIPNTTDFERAEEELNDERQIAWLERITSLQQVCTTIGPCWFVAAALVGVRWWFKGRGPFDLTLALAAFGMALVLVHLGWVKASQQAQYLHRHRSDRRLKSG